MRSSRVRQRPVSPVFQSVELTAAGVSRSMRKIRESLRQRISWADGASWSRRRQIFRGSLPGFIHVTTAAARQYQLFCSFFSLHAGCLVWKAMMKLFWALISPQTTQGKSEFFSTISAHFTR